MTDETRVLAEAEIDAAERQFNVARGVAERHDAQVRLDRARAALDRLPPAGYTLVPSDRLAALERVREAAEKVTLTAETDDDWDGEYIAFLVDADVLEALRAALDGGPK